MSPCSSTRPSLTAAPGLPCIFGPHGRLSDARRGTAGKQLAAGLTPRGQAARPLATSRWPRLSFSKARTSRTWLRLGCLASSGRTGGPPMQGIALGPLVWPCKPSLAHLGVDGHGIFGPHGRSSDGTVGRPSQPPLGVLPVAWQLRRADGPGKARVSPARTPQTPQHRASDPAVGMEVWGGRPQVRLALLVLVAPLVEFIDPRAGRVNGAHRDHAGGTSLSPAHSPSGPPRPQLGEEFGVQVHVLVELVLGHLCHKTGDLHGDRLGSRGWGSLQGKERGLACYVLSGICMCYGGGAVGMPYILLATCFVCRVALGGRCRWRRGRSR